MLHFRRSKYHHELWWLVCTPVCTRLAGRVGGVSWPESSKESEFARKMVHAGPSALRVVRPAVVSVVAVRASGTIRVRITTSKEPRAG